MKKITLTITVILAVLSFNISAQKGSSSEKYGNTLNLGLGIGGYAGYYGYIGHTVPVFAVNYELDVAKCFTLAPFISFYTYRNTYYYDKNSYNYSYFRETVVPIGVKGTYYFDQLLNANSNWDFYAAGSLGFAIVSSSWDNNYQGNKDYYHHASALFLDLHVGAEYHLTRKLGAFLDLSTGVSTIGLAIH